MGKVFYRPEGVLADAIPFYDRKNDRFCVFYLHDYRDAEGHGIGVDWDLLTTTDLAVYEDHGVALPRGGMDDRDLFVFTGSVIEYKDEYYIFYTGFSPFGGEKGIANQCVLRAKSKDLVHWEKDPDFRLEAPEEGYARHDWRDPFVYYCEETHRFHMLLAGRKGNCGAFEEGGVTVLCSSEDLERWQVEPDFWDPNLFYTHECPDLFRMGDWWYMIYSEYSHKHLTRYLMSKDGKRWERPLDDGLDGALFYAAKSAANDTGRYLFGWIATREGDTDEGEPQWGGSLAVRELYQLRDGTLACRIPQSVQALHKGALQTVEDFSLQASAGRKFRWLFPEGDNCMASCRVQLHNGDGEFGMAISTRKGDRSYCFTVNPCDRTVTLEKKPNVDIKTKYTNCINRINGEISDEFELVLIYEDGAAQLCTNGTTMLSGRFYPKEPVGISFFAENCHVELRDIQLRRQD